MNSEEKLTDPEYPPTQEKLEEWLGKRAYGYWSNVSAWITHSYPGIFSPEWLFGGKKNGWYLRYKKSKSFCQFIPRRKKFVILIVFGLKEREKVEQIKNELSSPTKAEYDNANTYHDGKWLFLTVSNKTTVLDVQRLLSIKRKIKEPKHT